ncbi:MAG: hypothetical protein OHK0022_19990 [Roseiflexaceae bacterium]
MQIAALDAYLGAVLPHRAAPEASALLLPTGTPPERARARDEAIASLLQIAPGQKVGLIGVVNPLVAVHSPDLAPAPPPLRRCRAWCRWLPAG